MQTLVIKFLSEEGRVNGFYELITRSQVSSLPGQIYQVSLSALSLLEQRQIPYRRATDDEVKMSNY